MLIDISQSVADADWCKPVCGRQIPLTFSQVIQPFLVLSRDGWLHYIVLLPPNTHLDLLCPTDPHVDFRCWLESLSQFQQFGCGVFSSYHSFLYWTIAKAKSACWIMDCPSPLLKERPDGSLLLLLSWPLPPHSLILPVVFKLFGSLEGLFSIHRLIDLSVPSPVIWYDKPAQLYHPSFYPIYSWTRGQHRGWHPRLLFPLWFLLYPNKNPLGSHHRPRYISY